MTGLWTPGLQVAPLDELVERLHRQIRAFGDASVVEVELHDGIRYALDRLLRPGQGEAVREKRGDRFPVGLHQPDRGEEIRCGGATRSDDVDLLLGEDARAQGSGRRGHPHHHDPPRGAHHAQCLRQGRGVAGGVDHPRRPFPVGPGVNRLEQFAVAAPGHGLRTHREREVTPDGHGVGGHDTGPGGGGSQRGGQPDGAGAEDDDLLAGRETGPVQGMHRYRHGLDEGCRLGIEVADAEDLGRRDGQQLLEPAVAMDPHQFQRHARVRAAGPARIAAPAAMQRPHGDPVPGSHAARAVLADLLDDGAELVALDPREE